MKCKKVAGSFFFLPYFAEQPKISSNVKWGGVRAFGWYYEKDIEAIPNWFASSISGRSVNNLARVPWWSIADFISDLEDIKSVWEASRFDWSVELALAAICGDAKALEKLNQWLEDWRERNPCYLGPNWKCGQEASIRVLHLALTALLLGQADSATSALLDFVEAHLLRIEPTMGYAKSQNNNHGISEAAALFIGGSMLLVNGKKQGKRISDKGRKALEERVRKLFDEEGGFSQYSLNYHRLALDTCSLVELWRRRFGLKSFSQRFMDRLAKASEWLRDMTDPITGNVPNIGSNDGAKLFPVPNEDYRDYRSSIQLACLLFQGKRAFKQVDAWEAPFGILGLEQGGDLLPATLGSRLYDKGGFAVLRAGKARVIIRYPRFRFRPNHADALHLDLWLAGENLLRDGGSYSYSADFMMHNYYTGTVSHNTIQFDDRDQMPRIGRFLFGEWLKMRGTPLFESIGNETRFAAAYRDYKGARHERRVKLSENSLVVEDHIDGFKRRAVLRWRLSPGDWRIDSGRVTDGRHSFRVTSSANILRFELTTGWESLYYLNQTSLPVLEVEVAESSTIISEFYW
jgi:hypothetical protein